MDIRKMVVVIAIAAAGMLAWTTFKVFFVHDPENFHEMDARPYAVSWMMDHCKAYQCDNAGGEDGTPFKVIDEADEGWVYVIATRKEPGEVVLLVPRDNPHDKHLVTLREEPDGEYTIVDNGMSEEEKGASRIGATVSRTKAADASSRAQGKVIVGVLALLLAVLAWFYKSRLSAARAAGMLVEAAGTHYVATGSTSAPAAAARLKQGDGADTRAEKYRALLGQDRNKAAALARTYVGELLQAGKGSAAVQVFKDSTSTDPSFALAQPEAALPLAKAALAAGDVAVAVAALRGFDKKHPGHALIPEVYVFSAKLMREKLGNAETAKKVFEHIVAKYPGHFVAQEARRELQAMA